MKKAKETPTKRGVSNLAPIDWPTFEKLCAIQATRDEIAAWFQVTWRTLQRRVYKQYGMSFEDTFAKKRVSGLLTLRRHLFQQAEHNVAAAIFLAKNHLGMSDRQEVEHSGTQTINVKVTADQLSDDELAAIIRTNGHKDEVVFAGKN